MSTRIAAGQSLSGRFFLGGRDLCGAVFPPGWETADVTFQVSADGVNWSDLQVLKSDGSALEELKHKASAGKAVSFAAIADHLRGIPWLKIRSGTASSAVTQGGAVAAKRVFDFGGGRTLTITSGAKGPAANAIEFSFTTAGDDTLAVTKIDSASRVNVAFANATSSKNSAAAIEALVQALSTVGGVDVSAMTVAESDAYAADRPVRPAASKTFWFQGDKSLTFTSGVRGEVGNAIKVTFDTNTVDDLAVSKDGNTIIVKFATTTAADNADTAIQSAIRALAALGEGDDAISLSAFSVTGNDAYDGAPVTGVKASKTFTLDTGKTLTFESGVVGPESNGLKISIGTNDSDALDVSADGDVITVLLATTTASNNADTAITAAIRALDGGEVAGVPVTGFTVTGNTAYDNAPVTALGEGITISEVPLAGGRIAIDPDLFVEVPLEGGLIAMEDDVYVAVPLEGGSELACDPIPYTPLEGGDDAVIELLVRG